MSRYARPSIDTTFGATRNLGFPGTQSGASGPRAPTDVGTSRAPVRLATNVLEAAPPGVRVNNFSYFRGAQFPRLTLTTRRMLVIIMISEKCGGLSWCKLSSSPSP